MEIMINDCNLTIKDLKQKFVEKFSNEYKSENIDILLESSSLETEQYDSTKSVE